MQGKAERVASLTLEELPPDPCLGFNNPLTRKSFNSAKNWGVGPCCQHQNPAVCMFEISGFFSNTNKKLYKLTDSHIYTVYC